MTARVAATIDVRVPAERAFAALVDLPSQDRWIIATTLRALDGPVQVPSVGSKLAARTALGPVGFTDTMEVTEYLAGRRWAVVHTGKIVRGTGVFTAEPSGPVACRVTWVEEVVLPFGAIGRAGWPIVRPLLRMGLLASLKRLAAGLENGTLPVNRSGT